MLNTNLWRLFFLLAAFYAPLPLAAAQPFSGKVVGVIDGDTIEVLRNGKALRIRLAGIDCPEKGQDFGARAKARTSTLAFGKIVAVKDLGKEKWGKPLGEVSLSDGKILNQELVKEGLCWWYKRYAPKDRALAELERQARIKKLGLWSLPNPKPPWDYREGRGS